MNNVTLRSLLIRIVGSSLSLAFVAVLHAQADELGVQFSERETQSILSHGPWPQAAPHDAGNALSGNVWAQDLGKSLFFDKTLSKQSQFSCASCHVPDLAFTDGMPVAIGAEKGVRNTQGLLDVGLQNWFGWDGGADSLWAASLRPMLAEHEMASTIDGLAAALRNNPHFVQAVSTYYKSANVKKYDQGQSSSESKNTFPLAELEDDEIVVIAAKSIAAYTRTLRSGVAAFDRFRESLISNNRVGQQAYPASAKRGLAIFLGEANCRVCHFGANFSNGEFHDTGRPFFTGVGQVDPGRFTGIERVRQDPYNLLGEYAQQVSEAKTQRTANVKLSQNTWGQWRTPSLRNLKQTAPYMHDGSLATLRDVVDAYADIDPDRLHAAGESILKPLSLSEEQREDLVAFLLSLSAD